MPSGWVRWLLEQYEFAFEVVYASMLDQGDLAAKYDVLIFVDDAIPAKDVVNVNPEAAASRRNFGGGLPDNIPDEYKNRIENVTVAKTVPQLMKFVEAGGTLLTIGSSTSIGYHAKLPILDSLTEKGEDGSEKPLPRRKYYVPASILLAQVDTAHPLTYGVPNQVHVFFDNSPVFRIQPESSREGVRRVAWYNKSPLRSGWAWGEEYLENGIAIIDADVGKGKLVLFGPEITFRAQPHRTFKFLFNGIYYGHTIPENF
jgi:hypothetical protein